MKSIAKYKIIVLISYSYMDESRGTGSWFFTALTLYLLKQTASGSRKACTKY